MSSAGSPQGGFFGSMMNGSPNAFMSPPMDPSIMALLTKLSGLSGGQAGAGQAPNISALPPGATLAPGATLPGNNGTAPMNGMPPTGPAGQPGGMPGFGSINPMMLRAILQRLGIGGGQQQQQQPTQ